MADFSPLSKIFANKDRDERPQAGARFGLSWPLLAALSLVLVCAVAWAFFMGYMVGKGEHPTESLGAIAGLTSSQEREEPSVFVEPPKQAPEAASGQEDAQARLMAPPSGQAAAAWPAPAAQAPAAPAVQQRRQPARANVEKAAPGTKYNYTFQVAAIRNKAEAEKMRARLADMKLKASVQKSGKVHLLMVTLRGDANDVARMKDKLKSVHLGKPLQISKKPVAPAKNGRKK